MTDDLDPRELALGSRIATLADAALRVREPTDVVRAATNTRSRRWSGRLPMPAVGLALAIAVGVANVIGQSGGGASQAAEARVGGLTYRVGIVRTIRLDDARLTPVGDATQNGGFRTLGSTAYRVDDIDPSKVLVMRLMSGQTDGAGPIGDYLLLVRGEDGYRLTCPYFASGDPLAGIDCR